MRFLVDAQLPRRLACWLSAQGHDTLHTLDLPGKNATTDAEIVAHAVAENRAVITKDDDFVQSFLLTGAPSKLLLISTGNIGNAVLEAIFQKNLTAMVAAFDSAAFVELSRENLIIHG